jgi:hypothetical protein
MYTPPLSDSTHTDSEDTLPIDRIVIPPRCDNNSNDSSLVPFNAAMMIEDRTPPSPESTMDPARFEWLDTDTLPFHETTRMLSEMELLFPLSSTIPPCIDVTLIESLRLLLLHNEIPPFHDTISTDRFNAPRSDSIRTLSFTPPRAWM